MAIMVMPSSLAIDTASASPRALNEPVGRRLSSLTRISPPLDNRRRCVEAGSAVSPPHRATARSPAGAPVRVRDNATVSAAALPARHGAMRSECRRGHNAPATAAQPWTTFATCQRGIVRRSNCIRDARRRSADGRPSSDVWSLLLLQRYPLPHCGRGYHAEGRADPFLVHQAVELAGVLAGHLAGDFGRQMRELLVDVLLRLRPHAVGVREVRAPH